MTERFQSMKDTTFQIIMGALVTALLGVSGFIALTAVTLSQNVAVLSERVETANTRLVSTINETKENQEQIYKLRWELAQWKKEEQESTQ